MAPARPIGNVHRSVLLQCGIWWPEGVLTPNIQPNNTVPSRPGATHRCAPVDDLNPLYLQQWHKGGLGAT